MTSRQFVTVLPAMAFAVGAGQEIEDQQEDFTQRPDHLGPDRILGAEVGALGGCWWLVGVVDWPVPGVREEPTGALASDAALEPVEAVDFLVESLSCPALPAPKIAEYQQA